MTIVNQADAEIRSFTNHQEFRQAAKDVLPVGVFDFIDGGAGDESTLTRNRKAIDSVSITGQMLKGNFTPNTQTRVFGVDLHYPIAIAPMAYHGMINVDGELATARVAAQVGIPLILSTMSTVNFCELKDLGAKIWFQLYVMKDQRLTYSMIDEAINGGCELLVLTIDVPVFGRRLRDEKNNFKPSACFTQTNKVRQAGAKLFGNHLLELEEAVFVSQMFKSDLDWNDIKDICDYSSVPVVLKGVMTERDALLAKQFGAAGVIVSNHGGRQFDSHPASITVLPEISKAWSAPGVIGVDGGFTNASDIFKGLALGSDIVLLGRTVLYALASGGESMLTSYLNNVTSELTRTMRLMGLNSLARHEIESTLTVYRNN